MHAKLRTGNASRHGAWLWCPREQEHHRHPYFARNLSRSFFETPQKRCNSNDANSMFEQAAGELRAKLMGGGGAWPRCRWAVAGPGRASRRRAERSSQRGRRAGGPPPMAQRGPTGVEGAGGAGGPGRGAGGRRQGQGGPRDRPLRAFRLACGDLAGGPPPTGASSGL